MSKDIFRLWATSCSHVHAGLCFGRGSLAQAIRQSEMGGEEGGPSYDWDIALHLGDLVGCLPLEDESRSAARGPTDAQGREVVRQFSALQDHRREDIYNLAGTHDASTPGEPCQWWFQKWIDPTGENTEYSGVDPSRRPYPVEGTWERYAFRAGNILFLIMSDRNDVGPPVGRASWGGGYPAGAVRGGPTSRGSGGHLHQRGRVDSPSRDSRGVWRALESPADVH